MSDVGGGALNYEGDSERSLTLTASDTNWDAGSAVDDARPALSATAAATVHLTDVNDPPALASAGVHATGLVVPRDVPQGAEVASLASFVHDEDHDALAYAMVDDDDGSIASPLFDVHGESGRLTVGTLDM